MRAQITLTVNEAKRIIAKGVCRMPEVRAAMESGKIFLKGGSTTSAVCEELTGRPLRMSGRITPLGAKAPKNFSLEYHCALIDKGEASDPGDDLEVMVARMKRDDVAVIGANAIDSEGGAAIMHGAPPPGNPGRIISGLICELANVIIVASLEKLVPTPVSKLVAKAARRHVDVSMGMAVGLSPLAGRLITEVEALSLLANIECTVIGRGGISGAEGSTTMIVDGAEDQVKTVMKIVQSVKGAKLSCVSESIEECQAPNAICKLHKTCIYRVVAPDIEN
ncbi:MAG: hypothetical protein KKB20_09890 [Proteobacteria bacterium]|nr:hypothetical protein [Pseudomonadota bacterium]